MIEIWVEVVFLWAKIYYSPNLTITWSLSKNLMQNIMEQP